MSVLLDTNVLCRLVEPKHPLCNSAGEAIRALQNRGDELFVVPQVLYEFWVVVTRPENQNGLGLTAQQAALSIQLCRRFSVLLPESRGIFRIWQRLVRDYEIIGKSAHDARLAAAVIHFKLDHIVTFNDTDFRRFREISVLTPEQIG